MIHLVCWRVSLPKAGVLELDDLQGLSMPSRSVITPLFSSVPSQGTPGRQRGEKRDAASAGACGGDGTFVFSYGARHGVCLCWETDHCHTKGLRHRAHCQVLLPTPLTRFPPVRAKGRGKVFGASRPLSLAHATEAGRSPRRSVRQAHLAHTRQHGQRHPAFSEENPQ